MKFFSVICGVLVILGGFTLLPMISQAKDCGCSNGWVGGTFPCELLCQEVDVIGQCTNVPNCAPLFPHVGEIDCPPIGCGGASMSDADLYGKVICQCLSPRP